MSIQFTCPHCGSQTNVDEQYAGQSGPCASCGRTISVPLSAGAPFAPASPTKSSSGAMIAVIVIAALGALFVCGGALSFLFLPWMMNSMPVSGRPQCSNNLKQIGLAIHNYHDVYKCLPAAVLTDENDRPMRSWRVAILPFAEQAPIYDMYDPNEPWDSPVNSVLLEFSLSTYCCPDDYALAPGETSYVMIVGEGTIGGNPNETVRLSDVLDGTSNTIMAMEMVGSGIPWAEPRDITVEEAVAVITDPSADHVHPGGVNVLFTDGSVRFLPNSIDPQMLRAMLTRNDGQAVQPNF